MKENYIFVKLGVGKGNTCETLGEPNKNLETLVFTSTRKRFFPLIKGGGGGGGRFKASPFVFFSLSLAAQIPQNFPQGWRRNSIVLLVRIEATLQQYNTSWKEYADKKEERGLNLIVIFTAGRRGDYAIKTPYFEVEEEGCR